MAGEVTLDPTAGDRHHYRLASLEEDFVPKNLVGDIFAKAEEDSLVLRMADRIEVGYGQTVIPVTTTDPEAGQVGGTTLESREGARKPVSGVAWGSRSFSPIKVATIVTASEEFARTNPQGLFSSIQGKLSRAIGRAVDLAVFHGLQPINGGALTGVDPDNVLVNTPNAVDVDPATDDVVTKLLEGYDMVSSDYEFDGWAVDPRYRSTLAAAQRGVDVNGNVLNPGSISLGARSSELLGLRAEYGRAVGGDLGEADDSGVRLFGGDWNQLKFGMADQIRFKVSDQASIQGPSGPVVSMWQTNQIAILCEVTFGWVVGDLDAFVKYGADVAGS